MPNVSSVAAGSAALAAQNASRSASPRQLAQPAEKPQSVEPAKSASDYSGKKVDVQA